MSLVQGKSFQDFVLGDFNSANIRKTQPLVVIFWRTECPTCRLTVPYFDRLQQLYPQAQIIGIVQNNGREVTEYCEQNGIKFRQFVDDQLSVTRQLRIHTVPAFWLTDATGQVLAEGLGWDKSILNEIGMTIAQKTESPYHEVVTKQDQVPDFKPG